MDRQVKSSIDIARERRRCARERRRVATLREGFNSLKVQIPFIPSKSSQLDIVKNAIKYIEQLQVHLENPVSTIETVDFEVLYQLDN